MVRSIVTLVLLSVALAYSIFFKAGVEPQYWYETLLLLGCVSSSYWLFTRPIRRAPPLENWLFWPLVFLPIYVLFQLIPFGQGVLQLVSPRRAALLRDLQRMLSGVRTAPLTVNPPASVLGLFTILACIVIFLLIREIGWRFPAQPWAPAIPLIVIGALEASLGMFQVFAGWPSVNASGTYASRDHFAGLLEMILPFAVLYGVAKLRSKKKGASPSTRSALLACVMWAIAAVLLLAIVYSLSRAGFLAALFTLLTIGGLILAPRFASGKFCWPSVGVIAAAIVLMFVFLSPTQLIERFADISSSDKMSAETRLSIWSETMPLMGEYRLFGCGLGGFESVFLKHQTVAANYRIEFAHNDYLQYLAELGIVGFSILAAIMIGIVIQLLHGALRAADESRRLLIISCVGGFAGILLHSLVDFNMYIPANMLTLAWIAGIGSANTVKTWNV